MTRTAGFCKTSRPTRNFCRLPPDSDRASAFGPVVRTSKCLMMFSAKFRGLLLVDDPETDQRLAGEAGQEGVLRQRHRGDRAMAVALLRDKAAVDPPPLMRTHMARRNPVDHDAFRPPGRNFARQRIHQFTLPVAGDAGDAEDLAALQRQRNFFQIRTEMMWRADRQLVQHQPRPGPNSARAGAVSGRADPC